MKDFNVCVNCAARHKCGAAVEYGSIMCTINRMQSGQTKGDFVSPKRSEPLYCQYCGKSLKIIGNQRFCNNVQCLNRYKEV